MSININEYKSNLKNPYRPEIDGLRAFAVFAVIVNHFNKAILPNGYLGVDIFFVISGYVLASSNSFLIERNGFVYALNFFAKRFQRLLPSLLIYLIIFSFKSILNSLQPPVLLISLALHSIHAPANEK